MYANFISKFISFTTSREPAQTCSGRSLWWSVYSGTRPPICDVQTRSNSSPVLSCLPAFLSHFYGLVSEGNVFYLTGCCHGGSVLANYVCTEHFAITWSSGTNALSHWGQHRWWGWAWWPQGHHEEHCGMKYSRRLTGAFQTFSTFFALTQLMWLLKGVTISTGA